MLVSADWVLPISREPLRDGAVIVEHGRIVEVGPTERLSQHPAAREHRHFEGCVLMPGLVNAHTHLSLTALSGLIEPCDFDVWLPRLVKAMSEWTHDDYAISAVLGAQRCLQSGVTVVGDIVYGPEPVSAAGEAGLGGTFFWEVLGISEQRLYAELEEAEFPLSPNETGTARVRYGLSPHSPYTSGPGLLRAVHRLALELNVPVATHVAESPAETQLLLDGTGPLAPTAERLAKGFAPPGIGAVSYLDRLGVLDSSTAIHLSQILPTEIPRLAAAVRGAVTCPRSNRYLGSSAPQVRRMLHAGVPVGVGTDSQASNEDLDLLSELRELRAEDDRITDRQLLEMATAMGAIALGLEDRYGVLERGMLADLAIFRLGPTGDPEAAMIESGGAETIEAVFSAGAWRVLGGGLCHPRPGLGPAITESRGRAMAALQD